jgi:hypothetical protein
MPAQARPHAAGDRLVRIVGGGRRGVDGPGGNTAGRGRRPGRENREVAMKSVWS